MRHILYFLIILVGALPFVARATEAGVIEQLQMPAWLERGGVRKPLQAGTGVRQVDILETGRGGRLHVQFSDGSLLKLGEQTRVSLEDLAAPNAQGGTFHAFFDIVQGSFRFITGKNIHPWQRDIKLRSRSTTVDVRQADVCGQVNPEVVVVCLLTGTLTVEHAATGRFDMRQPRTVFVAPMAGEPPPIAPADPEMLKAWLDASELVPRMGITLPHGGWVVQLAAFADVRAADALAQRLRQAGYAVKAKTTQLHNRTIHRLRVENFDSKAEAEGFAKRIADQFRITHPWVTCAAATSCP